MRSVRSIGRRISIGALSLAGVVVAPTTTDAKDERPAEVVTDLGRRLDEAIRAAAGEKLWGAVLVAKGGEIVLSKGYGFADYRAKPVAPDSLFELASASKQVTATAILRLEQQKRLATTDRLTKFLKDLPADKRAITLDHLLHHTAGLSPELGVPYAWTGTRDAYVKEVLGKPLVATPGARFAYSNVGYALLAAVVEEVTGKPFEDYVRRELFAAAGLKDTGFILDERLVKSDRVTRRACDDCQADWTAASWFWGWGYRGMGGVVTTTLDVLAWDRALRGEKILGAPAKKKLYAADKEHYACGWKVESTDRGTTKASHSGGVRGYATLISRWLEEDVVVVFLSNGKCDPYAVERAVDGLLFRPPTLSAVLDVEGLEANANGAYEYAEGLAIEAEKRGATVSIRLRHGSKVLATITAPPGVAAKAADDLDQAAAASSYPTPDEPAVLVGGLYLGFIPDHASHISIDDGLSLEVLDHYVGRSPTGETVEDPRAVLILKSTGHGGWPLMVKLNPKAAKAVAAALRR